MRVKTPGLNPVAVFVAAIAAVVALLVAALLLLSLYYLYAYNVCFVMALTVLLGGGGLVAVLYRRVGDPSE